MSMPRLAVVGSVNLDLVARASHLPAPGETVGGAAFARHPGGKGANQALAALRLGAPVALRDIGMPADGLDRAADVAMNNAYWNPRPLERDAIRELLQAAWKGCRP